MAAKGQESHSCNLGTRPAPQHCLAGLQAHGVLLAVNALVAAGLPSPQRWLSRLLAELSQRSWLLTQLPACSLAVQAEYIRAVQAACALVAAGHRDPALQQQASELHQSTSQHLRLQLLPQRAAQRSSASSTAAAQQAASSRGCAHTGEPSVDSAGREQSGVADPMWVQHAKQGLSCLLSGSFQAKAAAGSPEPGPAQAARSAAAGAKQETGSGPEKQAVCRGIQEQPAEADQAGLTSSANLAGSTERDVLEADVQAALQSSQYEVRAACLKLLIRRCTGMHGFGSRGQPLGAQNSLYMHSTWVTDTSRARLHKLCRMLAQ